MKSWKKPTLEQVKKAILLFSHGEQHRYFFDRLENPEWLTPLKEKRYFSSPPSPIRDESRGTITFPPWPESRYLVRMAKLAPEIVAEILFEIPETENSRVHDDIAEALLALPARLAVRMVPKPIEWTRSPFQLLLPEKLGALVSHLATHGEIEPALRLARALLAVRADPRATRDARENELFYPKALPYFEPWHYQKILEKNIPDLLAVAADETLALLCDLLDDAVRFSQRADNRNDPDDFSYTWRTAIDQPQYTVDDVRGLLVSAVLRAAEQNASNNPQIVPDIVLYLESRRWRVFHRVALHVLRRFASATPSLVSEGLKEPERFDRSDFRREYNLLTESCFGRLEADDKTKILDWIQRGPDIERFKAGWQTFYGSAPNEEEVTRYTMAWQRDRLAPLVRELPVNWSQYYEQLVTAVGPPSEEEHISSATWGWTSPKSAEELRGLMIEQLVNFLRSWEPSGRTPMEASIAGLAQQLGALVVSEPERFAAEAEKFQGLDPTYVRALLQALSEPAKQKSDLNWQKVLALCCWVVEQPRRNAPQKATLGERDPDWGWTRKAIARLLTHGFESDALPSNSREEAWYVLERLTNDPEPTPEDELKNDGKTDFASLSINTIRWEAMHGVVEYALWIRRRIENEPGFNVGEGFDRMPEVRTVLDRHLDPGFDPSLAIRAVYGQWFPWLHLLDRQWATENAPRIPARRSPSGPPQRGMEYLHRLLPTIRRSLRTS
jgi:hypothetical protein